ncbi:hypothetical protein CHS0354_014936 [Potamilus streckersoni]|uniref:Structure-specific endonuclease subunit SLX1 homolog n=1 Tax=Potamilus streckersoni TaxID=2493646 RepID=A0AAE0S888_9BIVA|nr:hypothetical protein CHS0354_014936 [Potamilus streckersoni]
MAQEVENFFGVYLLYNVNPQYKGRTYIGYTVNPNRRIRQHNRGKQAGGACRTDGKGPWEMVLIIHGFPNDVSALRFEWAWQHPEKSRRLKHITRKQKKESAFDFRFRILSEMLRTGPWNRLTLTIRWLKQNYHRDFPPKSTPPLHMPIAYGPVISKKVTETKETKVDPNVTSSEFEDDDELISMSQATGAAPRCSVCFKRMQDTDTVLTCYHPKCPMKAQIICLSQKFLSADTNSGLDHILPVSGSCPHCQQPVLWGDLIRHKQGCYHNLSQNTDSNDIEDDHWADELQTQVI